MVSNERRGGMPCSLYPILHSYQRGKRRSLDVQGVLKLDAWIITLPPEKQRNPIESSSLYDSKMRI